MDRFPEGVAWIRSLGVDVKDAQRVLSFGRVHQFDTHQYVDTCRRVIHEGAGALLLETCTERLVVEDGAVTGAELRLADGARMRVSAGAFSSLTPGCSVTGSSGRTSRGRWGYRGDAVRDAVKLFNEDAAAGLEPVPGRQLEPPPARRTALLRDRDRTGHHVPLARCTHRRPGSRAARGRRTAPRLLAAGSDTGGLWHRAYAGGIASALVFGLTAADTATAATATASAAQTRASQAT
ncbi:MULTISPECIES: hypothetical protein [Streptomyces violaceusniger group]|uniref:FAD dependent oxidoreductase domain-containing protein n=1 Tax=Streptomyces antimycoticus TaxID=68175 RepID=A0ABD5J2E6_9ACTN|nr:hypothetical protein [Streptomyces violaceusniger]MEE4582109.1 hypothetical protein [Streptomyces sp. DSM 41602]